MDTAAEELLETGARGRAGSDARAGGVVFLAAAVAEGGRVVDAERLDNGAEAFLELETGAFLSPKFNPASLFVRSAVPGTRAVEVEGLEPPTPN